MPDPNLNQVLTLKQSSENVRPFKLSSLCSVYA